MTFEQTPYGLDVTADHPCDRCGHQDRRHNAGTDGSACRVKGCPCDGYFAVGAKEVAS